MYQLRFFIHKDEALRFRHEHGAGGWIFVPEEGESILFPPCFPPIKIFNHPATKGRTGKLIGCA